MPRPLGSQAMFCCAQTLCSAAAARCCQCCCLLLAACCWCCRAAACCWCWCCMLAGAAGTATCCCLLLLGPLQQRLYSTYCSSAGIAPNLMMTTSLPDAAWRKISPLISLICHLDPLLVQRPDVACSRCRAASRECPGSGCLCTCSAQSPSCSEVAEAPPVSRPHSASGSRGGQQDQVNSGILKLRFSL